MPMWFQDITFMPLSALAKALGKDPVFPEYSRPPGWTGDHDHSDHSGTAHTHGPDGHTHDAPDTE
jgi:hypothetical protein